MAPVYKSRLPHEIPPEAEAALQEGQVDILTFTSSATVHNFVQLLGQERVHALAAKAVVAAIGPITVGDPKGIRPHPADRTGRLHHPGPGRRRLLTTFRKDRSC